MTVLTGETKYDLETFKKRVSASSSVIIAKIKELKTDATEKSKLKEIREILQKSLFRHTLVIIHSY